MMLVMMMMSEVNRIVDEAEKSPFVHNMKRLWRSRQPPLFVLSFGERGEEFCKDLLKRMEIYLLTIITSSHERCSDAERHPIRAPIKQHHHHLRSRSGRIFV
jgi:hypothetical protein